jgi:hypothetical protein
MKYKVIKPKSIKVKLVTTRSELSHIVNALEQYKINPQLAELYQVLQEAYDDASAGT